MLRTRFCDLLMFLSTILGGSGLLFLIFGIPIIFLGTTSKDNNQVITILFATALSMIVGFLLLIPIKILDKEHRYCE